MLKEGCALENELTRTLTRMHGSFMLIKGQGICLKPLFYK